ncbi:MAG: transporter substrate-binding domain-containing protein, partial [Thiotrichaceae bacterium]|nr:transporter substrate-binding domain-containing protein [Thiotrichaceae bacterium]
MKLNILLISLLFFLVGCSDDKENRETTQNKSPVIAKDTLPEKLVVVTRNAPTTWYHGRDTIEGPEFDLIKAFTDDHKISLEVEVVDSISEVLQWVKDGKAQIAAAGLTDTEERRQQGIIFGPQYHQVQQLVVCRRKTIAIPKTVADLVGVKITVIKDSSYVDRLKQLKQNNPELDWIETDEMDTEQLLKMVWEKKIDCTVADSNIVSINRRYYPELLVAFALSEKQPLAWVINDEWDFLRMKIDAWFESEQTAGKIAALHEKYYGHIDLFNFVDMRAFNRRIKSRYPKYKELFEKNSNKYGLDPTLLAAQSYQES